MNTDTETKTKKHPLVRFSKYTSLGVSTFALDLALLYILTDYLHIHYLLSAALAFALAVSLNYLLSRRLVFKGTERAVHTGYAYFLIIAGIGLIAVTALMYVSVEILRLDYLMSRILIAGLVGMWTYLMNLYMNFKVAGS